MEEANATDVFKIKKATVKAALLYGLVSAVMTISLAWGIAAAVDDNTEEQTNQTVAVILKEASETRHLFCRVLRQSENPEIVQAVQDNCGTA